MKLRTFFPCFLMLLSAFPLTMKADDAPSASPVMTIEESGTATEETDYSGSAPIVAHFKANPQSLGSYTPYYEWRFYTSGKESSPFLIRYEENTDYTFTTSGATYIKLYVTFVQGTDSIVYEMDDPLSVTASESKLEMPNAFSPNGDGQNDVYKAKEGYQSIISFHAYIFNRWGKQLYDWSNLDGGWDGTCKGTKMKDGVYFCLVEARGADGKIYKIKKDVNLLRGYQDKESSSSTTGN